MSAKLLQTKHCAARGSALLFQKQIWWCLLSAKANTTFGAKDISCLDKSYRSNETIIALALYKADKLKEEGRANLAILFVFLSSFHTLLLSHQSVL